MPLQCKGMYKALLTLYISCGTTFPHGEELQIVSVALLDNSNTSYSYFGVLKMAYNLSVKKYANGTMQIKYFDNPILMKDDRKVQTCSELYDSEVFEEIFDDDMIDWSFDEVNNTSQTIYHTPFGDVENLSDVKDIQPVNELTQEELERKKARSISTSLKRTKNDIYDYGRNNTWDWFITFTISPDVVCNRYDLQECSKKIRKVLNNLKARKCPNLSYLIVPELHPSSGAYHFHGLLSGIDDKKELRFRIARNKALYQKDKQGNLKLDKNGQPVPNLYYGEYLRTSYPNGNLIYDIPYFSRKLGFVQATKIHDTRKAVSYISKYVTKELVALNFGKRRYYHSNNLIKPNKEVYMIDSDEIDFYLIELCRQYGMDYSSIFSKTVNVDIDGFSNTIHYFEFSSKENLTIINNNLVETTTGEIIRQNIYTFPHGEDIEKEKECYYEFKSGI